MSINEAEPMLKYQVYQIVKIPTRGYSYTFDREEIWSVQLNAAFASEDDAKEYVVKMNRKYCGYELGILHSNDYNLIVRRCTDPEWCHLQRYFIGYPNTDMISDKLRKDNIRVLRKSKL